MVQINVPVTALVAATVIAPALAQSYYAEDALVSREDFDEVYARDLEFDFQERDFDAELIEREPILGFKHLKNFIGNHLAGPAPVAPAAPAADSMYAREYDDEYLSMREPILGFKHLKNFIGNHLAGPAPAAPAADAMYARGPGGDHHGGHGGPHDGPHGPHGGPHDGPHGPHGGPAADAPAAREFDEDMYARGPGGDHHGVHGGRHGGPHGGPPADAPAAREFDEDMYARGPGGGHHGGSHDGHHGGPHGGAPAAREYTEEDLDARDFSDEYEEVLARYFDDVYEREFAAEADLVTRDLEEAQVFSREPTPFLGFIKNFFTKKQAAPVDAASAARDFDDLD